MINVLLTNEYPLPFIFNILHECLKHLFPLNRSSDFHPHKSPSTSEDGDRIQFFNILYVPGISDRFVPLVRNLKIVLSHTSLNKLKNYIRVHKDPLPNNLRSNVVNKILCSDCDASYVGQTRRLLKTRIAEHHSHINKNSAQHSVITDHGFIGHEFAWDDVIVLDEELSYGKRLMSEMIFI